MERTRTFDVTSGPLHEVLEDMRLKYPQLRAKLLDEGIADQQTPEKLSALLERVLRQVDGSYALRKYGSETRPVLRQICRAIGEILHDREYEAEVMRHLDTKMLPF